MQAAKRARLDTQQETLSQTVNMPSATTSITVAPASKDALLEATVTAASGLATAPAAPSGQNDPVQAAAFVPVQAASIVPVQAASIVPVQAAAIVPAASIVPVGGVASDVGGVASDVGGVASAVGGVSPADAPEWVGELCAAMPEEVLARILHHLAVADLIACRKVCRRWRASVAAMEARDAPFVFRCGLRDILRQWYQNLAYNGTEDLELLLEFNRVQMQCTCGVALDTKRAWTALAEDYEWDGSADEDGFSDDDDWDDDEVEDVEETLTTSTDIVRRANSGDHQDNSAGAAARSDPPARRRLRRFPRHWYKAQHTRPLPLARWQVMAAERDLTLQLLDEVRGIEEHSFVFHLNDEDLTFGCRGQVLPWLVYVPLGVVLPTTAAEMKNFVSDFVDPPSRWRVSRPPAAATASARRAEAAEAVNRRAAQALESAEEARFDRWAYERRREFGLTDIDEKWFHFSVLLDCLKADPKSEEGKRHFATLCQQQSGHSDAERADVARAWIKAYRAYEVAKAEGSVDDLLLDFDWMDVSEWTNGDFDFERGTPRPRTGNAARKAWRRDQASKFYALQGCVELVHPLFREAWDAASADDSGWALRQLAARQSAVAWRIVCSLGWSHWVRVNRGENSSNLLFPTTHFLDMTDDEVQDFLDRQVDAIDVAKERISSLCRLSVAFRTDLDDGLWFGGLSPRGNLVGAVVFRIPGRR